MSNDSFLIMHFRPQKKNAKTESLCVLINLLDGYQIMPIREPQARVAPLRLASTGNYRSAPCNQSIFLLRGCCTGSG